MPTASEFMVHLKRKAGLPLDFRSERGAFATLHRAQREKIQGAMMQESSYPARYGCAFGFCIDPIQKKPLNHCYPGSSVLSFDTTGCNLASKFFQNGDLSKSRDMDRLMARASFATIVSEALKCGCKNVAFTYNDPVIFAEQAMAVTAGDIHSQPRRDFYTRMDAAHVDLKALADDFYFKLTGSQLQPVLDTLIYLKNETQVWFEITRPKATPPDCATAHAGRFDKICGNFGRKRNPLVQGVA